MHAHIQSSNKTTTKTFHLLNNICTHECTHTYRVATKQLQKHVIYSTTFARRHARIDTHNNTFNKNGMLIIEYDQDIKNNNIRVLLTVTWFKTDHMVFNV